MRYLGHLEHEPERITADLGIPFREGMGDLGPFVWAMISINGERFALNRYRGSLEDGVEVYGTATGTSLLIARTLGIARSWIADEGEPA